MSTIANHADQIGLILGISLVLQPWWEQGLRVGFFLTLAATILHIITSHKQTTTEDNR